MIFRGYIGCTTTAQIRFIWGVYWSEQRKSDFSPRPPNDTVIKVAGDPRAVTSLWGSKTTCLFRGKGIKKWTVIK